MLHFGGQHDYVTSIFELSLHTARFGLDCMLHMHSESLITRARNKIVLKFLSDETLTHLFWIDSDIVFTPQSVCRLLLADRDVAAGVYPMKTFNWPAEAVCPRHDTRGVREAIYGISFQPYRSRRGTRKPIRRR